ncbi:hypothetical protein AB1Y20_021361 [Prymnesium parvum]|uniref:Uncharacterized protein n=1 Tax=Prymnesium parvum TaxID=97485 RepID=A0AB34JIG4_PRYPA
MPLSLASLLRAVPLARRSPSYYVTIFVDGESTFSSPEEDQWAAVPRGKVLELSAGRFARWSQRVSKEFEHTRAVAADLVPPSCSCAECIAVDNARLDQLAASEHARSFDLIFGSHMMCTCQWVLSPGRYLSGANEGQTAVTCGGVPIEPAGVDLFVQSVGQLLHPKCGIAIFDQEGGWPFGLESELRRAAKTQGLHFYTRKGPLWTNFDYVLSTVPLLDDVSPDAWQRDVRLVDISLLSFAPAVLVLIAAVRHGYVPRDVVPLLSQLKQVLALGIGVRLVLPFLDVHTAQDLFFALNRTITSVL